VRAALLALALAGAIVHAAPQAAAPSPAPHRAAPNARVESYFTPGDAIDRLIAARIDGARSTVRVAAYLFTNRRLAGALARAAKRGLAVELVADAAQFQSGGLPRLRELDRAGVRIWLREGLAAFHHKYVIVDAGTPTAAVVTGSFNFTQAAQERNAENVVVIGSREVAARFLADFERHRAASSRLQ
jgi:phosphatidylserine/phosphatidylglycerophosphate/cardiolipin synthase-like enzyme